LLGLTIIESFTGRPLSSLSILEGKMIDRLFAMAGVALMMMITAAPVMALTAAAATISWLGLVAAAAYVTNAFVRRKNSRLPRVTIFQAGLIDTATPALPQQAWGGPPGLVPRGAAAPTTGHPDLVPRGAAAPTTGHRETGHNRITRLVEIALELANDCLRLGGASVAKVFQGSSMALLARVKKSFREVRHLKPPSAAPMVRAAKSVVPNRIVNSASAPSIIKSDVVMIGTLSSDGDVQIECRIDGDICCTSLVIGDSGQVNGNIVAENVTVRGYVKGLIRARNVFLCSASHVGGDILSETFAAEIGATFDGNCRHCDNPLAEARNKG
jgi:cytoskeletal protein CcmA (bactofilin family)